MFGLIGSDVHRSERVFVVTIVYTEDDIGRKRLVLNVSSTLWIPFRSEDWTLTFPFCRRAAPVISTRPPVFVGLCSSLCPPNGTRSGGVYGDPFSHSNTVEAL